MESDQIKRQLERWLSELQGVPRLGESQARCAPSPDEGDRASDEYEKSFEFHLKERARASANEIKEALHKMYKGTYGICDGCGQFINARRLLARPATPYCIDCQSENEAA